MSSPKRRRARPDRSAAAAVVPPNYVLGIPRHETLTEQQVVAIESQAEWLLDEIGVDLAGDAELLERFEAAGARSVLLWRACRVSVEALHHGVEQGQGTARTDDCGRSKRRVP